MLVRNTSCCRDTYSGISMLTQDQAKQVCQPRAPSASTPRYRPKIAIPISRFERRSGFFFAPPRRSEKRTGLRIPRTRLQSSLLML